MAPTAPRECNQPTHHANLTSPRASSSHRIVSHPVHHRALHHIPYIATHRSNATSPHAAHCIANNPRIGPHQPQHITTTHLAPASLRTRFAVLCAGFVWFVVPTFPKFNLYTSRIAILSCVRSSVGTQLGLCEWFAFSVNKFVSGVNPFNEWYEPSEFGCELYCFGLNHTLLV